MSFKKTLLLPETNFPMRANIVSLEKEIRDFWIKINLSKKILEQKKDRDFYLHFGPPYANGFLHIGHALNILLKDLTLRSASFLGYRCHNKTGHDCHGLPIELAVQKLKNKDSTEIDNFLSECKNFAQNWIEKQRQQLEELNILCSKEYYQTFDEVQSIYITFSKILMKGLVYMKRKPVMWSITERTTIADAEIEYKTKESTALDLGFKINGGLFKNKYLCIWTTTPWSIEDNRAIALKKDVIYLCILIGSKEYFISKKSFSLWLERTKIKDYTILSEHLGTEFENTTYEHPIANITCPLIFSDVVVEDEGTGILHVAPAHGPEDFAMSLTHKIELSESIDAKGFYQRGKFKELHIFNDEEKIIEGLKHCLLGQSKIIHEYPYSSRGNIPLFYRSTNQIFIDINNNKQKILDSLNGVSWQPNNLKSRMYDYIYSRKEWCISRQRTWGVPLGLFINKKTGEILINEELQKKIILKMKNPEYFLKEDCIDILDGIVDREEYYPYIGVLDVWFDSGASFSYVTMRDGFSKDNVVYIEGNDQTRGWFQSSLLTSFLTEGRAPYGKVISHGFVVDGERKKMSKSKGNSLDLKEIISKYGSEILRLWVTNSDYSKDVSISEEILQKAQNQYLKIRKFMRFLLSISENHPDTEEDLFSKILENQLEETMENFKSNLEENRLRDALFNLTDFISSSSAGYFNAKKDVLYCDKKDSEKRKLVCHMARKVFKVLTLSLRVFLPITCEQLFMYSKDFWSKESIHLEEFNSINLEKGDNHKEFQKFEPIIEEMRVKIENFRQEKKINRNTDCVLYLKKEDINEDIGLIIREILGCSKVNFSDKSYVEISYNESCQRCFKRIELQNHLCIRCSNLNT